MSAMVSPILMCSIVSESGSGNTVGFCAVIAELWRLPVKVSSCE